MPHDDAPAFEDLPITERAREAAHGLGWRVPTPIQAAVLPQVARGRDVIGRAQTGSGKTGAYGLWLTDAVKAPGIQALVLAPTRELVLQIADDLNAMAKGADFRAVAIYGGVPYDPQLAALSDRQTTCVVATTGRLLDLLAKRQVLVDHVRIVVLDEADRMLDLGFLPDVERVLKLIPGGRQTALFTATMPKAVAMLAHRYMAHAREIEVGRTTPEGAEHYRVDVPSMRKMAALIALLEKERPQRALVFARTRDGAHALARDLQRSGFAALAMHGDLDQRERERVVAAFDAGEAKLVVATDVAARGLDIADVTHVINFDVPEEADQYVHRAGRTARAGKQGRIYTFVTENDGALAQAAERAAKTTLRPTLLTITEEGNDVVVGAKPIPPKPVMRGGNARGARPKNKPTPPKGVVVKEEREPEPRRAKEHDLPPSRRARRARDDGSP